MASTDQPSWSDIAAWYDDLLVAGSGPHATALECLGRLVPDVRELDVVDVACGQGLAARLLADRGARVAVDSSAAMIAHARQHGSPGETPIEYVVDDAEALAQLDDARFDGATCQLGLMDIADLDGALCAIARVLRPTGWLAFVIAHPCFLAPNAQLADGPDGRPAVTVTDYFHERFWRSTNPQGVRRAGNHHRMLSTYLNALTAAGFAIEHTEEPAADELLATQQPLYAEVPIFFAARTAYGTWSVPEPSRATSRRVWAAGSTVRRDGAASSHAAPGSGRRRRTHTAFRRCRATRRVSPAAARATGADGRGRRDEPHAGDLLRLTESHGPGHPYPRRRWPHRTTPATTSSWSGAGRPVARWPTG